MRWARQKIDELAQFAGIADLRSQLEEQHLLREPVLCRLFAGQGACPTPMSASWSTSKRPGFPPTSQPNDNAFWAHIDVDVLKLGSPMWTFPGHLRLQGYTGRILDQLLTD